MNKKGKQKRKLNQYKEYIVKKIGDDNKENTCNNQENEYKENIKDNKKKGKKHKNNKYKNVENDSILVTSKESCNLIRKIMTEGEKKKENDDNINTIDDDNSNDINDNITDRYDKNELKKKNNKNKKKEFEKKNNKDNNNEDNNEDNNNRDNNDNENNYEEKNKKISDKNNEKNEYDDSTNKSNEEVNNNNVSKKSNNVDNFLLSSLYDLFEGYDEIIIKPNNNNQYIIKSCLKIDEDKEIKFEIIYDKERDFFDYYPNNTNFFFENEDEPFNWDLDIPKEDFTLLIKNFKKYKNK